MTLNQSALLELTDVLRTADGGQVMRLMLSAMLQALVDAEATAHIGADLYERTPARTTQRNGTREKTVSTTAGDLMVKIPKLLAGRVTGCCPASRHRSHASPSAGFRGDVEYPSDPARFRPRTGRATSTRLSRLTCDDAR